MGMNDNESPILLIAPSYRTARAFLENDLRVPGRRARLLEHPHQLAGLRMPLIFVLPGAYEQPRYGELMDMAVERGAIFAQVNDDAARRRYAIEQRNPR